MQRPPHNQGRRRHALCEVLTKPDITSKSNTVKIHFVTNGDGNSRGWSMSWRAVTPYTLLGEVAGYYQICVLKLIILGLCVESARAVTGRRCPHSGEGEDFLTRQPGFFYENGCNSGTESRK